MKKGTTKHAPVPFIQKSKFEFKKVIPSQMDLLTTSHGITRQLTKTKDPDEKKLLRFIRSEIDALREAL